VARTNRYRRVAGRAVQQVAFQVRLAVPVLTRSFEAALVVMVAALCIASLLP
jgi:hypothetical protein